MPASIYPSGYSALPPIRVARSPLSAAAQKHKCGNRGDKNSERDHALDDNEIVSFAADQDGGDNSRCGKQNADDKIHCGPQQHNQDRPELSNLPRGL